MITQTSGRKVEASGDVLDTAKYHIDPSNVVHITQILRNIYSDPMKAVLREYLTNAIDAHNMTGQTRPIDIWLPDSETPYFQVRDYGPGLSVEETKQYLYGYGASNAGKRVSNVAIGGFGIGCKCAYALCDAFTYTIWHEGIKRVWSCFLDDQDMGEAKLMFEAPDAEPSGVQVTVPISVTHGTNYDARSKFHEILMFLDANVEVHSEGYYNPVPLTPVYERTVDCKVNGTVHKLELQLISQWNSVPYKGPIITIGGTAYQIDLDQVTTPETAPMGFWKACLIKAPIGFVQLAPSREEIQYSGLTKKILGQALGFMGSEEHRAKIGRALLATDLQDTRARFKLLEDLNLLEDPNHPHYTDSGFKLPKGMKLGHKLSTRVYETYNSHRYRFDSADVDEVKPKNMSKLSLTPTELQQFRDKRGHLIIVQSDGISNLRLIRRALSTYPGQVTTRYSSYHQQVIVAVANMADDLDVSDIPWVKDGSITVYKTSDLDEVRPELFVDPHRSASRSRGGPQNYSQHSKKLVALRDGGGYRSPSSQMWVPVEAKAITKGIFTVIDGFEPVSQSAVPGVPRIDSFSTGNMIDVRGKTPEIQELLPDMFPLYGVRVRDYESLRKASNFQSMPDYIAETLHSEIQAQRVCVDGLLLRLMFNDIDTFWESHNPQAQGRGTFNFQALVSSVATSPILTGKEFQRLATYWYTALTTEGERTTKWATALHALFGENSAMRANTRIPSTQKAFLDFTPYTSELIDIWDNPGCGYEHYPLLAINGKRSNKLLDFCRYIKDNHRYLWCALALGDLDHNNDAKGEYESFLYYRPDTETVRLLAGSTDFHQFIKTQEKG